MRRIRFYIVLIGVSVGVIVAIAIAAALWLIKTKKKEDNQSVVFKRGNDLELQQLSLSVRTTSDKKVSFDGSNPDGATATVTPRKPAVESYTAEELSKATEDFGSSNHIEGSVYHCRLNGKNLAIKRVSQETSSKLDFALFNHHHPYIMRLVGTCLSEESGRDSFLVFEYAKNGSLKDWLHGGLAIKNQFIASCYCFLTWSQRLRICLDVAMALHYMHHVMSPCYTHGNIKSRNIFLDDEFRAKLGNFGMENCVEHDADAVGYSAPECTGDQGASLISPSADVFAFGIVLLEVLSGKTPISRPDEKGESGIRLSEKVKLVLESEKAEEEMREWMDSALGERYSLEAAVVVAKLARACTEDDPVMRPTAEEVVERLARLVEESPPLRGECSLVSESCSKPLVKAVVTNNDVV